MDETKNKKMKKVIVGLFILLSIKSNAQKGDTIHLPLMLTTPYPITMPAGGAILLEGSGFDNELKRVGEIKETIDTIKCKYMIIDTTYQDNIFNGGSKVYYVNGYKVITKKGPLTLWADHSCPERRPGCCVYHTQWIEEDRPIVGVKYLTNNKKKLSSNRFIVHELN